MAQEGTPPESGAPTDAPTDAAPQNDARADTHLHFQPTPKKTRKVEAAKARVVAAKEAAQKKPPRPRPAHRNRPLRKRRRTEAV